jgi:nucleoside-diphosphate-sugar epimerase
MTGPSGASPRTVLVTGAVGFVAVNIVRALLIRGHRVIAADHRPPDEPAQRFLAPLAASLVWLEADVRHPAPLLAALQAHRVGAIVHAAAVTATTREWERDRAREVLDVNLMGTMAVLEAAYRAGVRRAVVVSSTSALGPGYRDGRPIPEGAPAVPADLYGISKHGIELVAARLADLYGLEVAAVRIAQPYGPMERPSPDRAALSPIAEWIEAAAAGRPLRTPSLEVAKDWTYVEDVAAGFVGLVEAARLHHPLYNLGGGEQVTVGQVMEAIRGVWPEAEVTVTADGPPNPNLDPARLRGPLEVVRLREEFGFSPRFDITRGIGRYGEWIRAGRGALPAAAPVASP